MRPASRLPWFAACAAMGAAGLMTGGCFDEAATVSEMTETSVSDDGSGSTGPEDMTSTTTGTGDPSTTGESTTDGSSGETTGTPDPEPVIESVGSDLHKAYATEGWSAGAASQQQLPAGVDGYVEFEVRETNTIRCIGLGPTNVSVSPESITYAFNFGGSTVSVHESGSEVLQVGSYRANDTFRIERIGNQIHYLRNGALLHVSAIPSQTVLLVDASLHSVAAALYDVRLDFGMPKQQPVHWVDTVGVFVDSDGLPGGQEGPLGTDLRRATVNDWFIWDAGARSVQSLAADEGGYVEFRVEETDASRMLGLTADHVGEDHVTISHALYASESALFVLENGANVANLGSYAPGDLLRVERVGTVIRYRKNGQLLHTSAATSTAELFVDTSFYDEHGAIYDAVIKRGDNDPESVTWTDIVGCHVDSDTAADGQESAPGSDLQNASRTSAWNAGAASEQMLGDAEDGYVECVADGSQTTRMLGFSAADTNVSYASIHYGFYLHPTGWTIYEKGVQMGVLGTYAQGDRLKVQRQSGVIRYMTNDEMVYESLVPSDTVLVVDTALYSPAAALHDVQIGGPDRVVEPVIWTNLMNVIVDDDHVSE